MTAPVRKAGPAEEAVSIQFRGGLYTLMRLKVSNPRDQAFFTALMVKIAQAPDFFRHAPVVLDLQDLADAPPFNMAELIRRLRQHQLVPVAVANGTDEQNKAAINAGISILRGGGGEAAVPQPAEVSVLPTGEPREAAAAAEPAAGQTLLVTQAVRSGQQIYARHSDIIVLASISAGAELLSDGHIHVYGTLRGRAHAGLTGNSAARIFCRSLEAELVSIAGFWRVREDMPDDLIGKPAQIFLKGEQVVIEPLP